MPRTMLDLRINILYWLLRTIRPDFKACISLNHAFTIKYYTRRNSILGVLERIPQFSCQNQLSKEIYVGISCLPGFHKTDFLSPNENKRLKSDQRMITVYLTSACSVTFTINSLQV